MKQLAQSITLSAALVVAAGCASTIADSENADDDVTAAAATLSANDPAHAVEICAGAATSKTGERCTELYQDETLLSCSHSINRVLTGDRHGDEVDTVHLVLSTDGSFVVTAESTSFERLNHRGRQIETSTRMFVEYQENADGVGRCSFGDGQWTDCGRSDPLLLDIGADPCTRDYLVASDV